MNLIEIAGHLGSDPEERFTPSGQKVVSFRVATRARKKGEDLTIWYRVTVWGDRFDRMLTYFKKGSAIIVVGELQKPEVYTDRNGQPQVSLDVTAEILKFSPFGKGGAPGQSGEAPMAAPAPQQQQQQPVAAAAAPAPNQFDDDLPF